MMETEPEKELDEMSEEELDRAEKELNVVKNPEDPRKRQFHHKRLERMNEELKLIGMGFTDSEIEEKLNISHRLFREDMRLMKIRELDDKKGAIVTMRTMAARERVHAEAWKNYARAKEEGDRRVATDALRLVNDVVKDYQSYGALTGLIATGPQVIQLQGEVKTSVPMAEIAKAVRDAQEDLEKKGLVRKKK